MTIFYTIGSKMHKNKGNKKREKPIQVKKLQVCNLCFVTFWPKTLSILHTKKLFFCLDE